MKKKLFGTLLFSVVLSSLAYAEADDVMTMKDKLEAKEEAMVRGQNVEYSNVVGSVSENGEITTTTTNLSPEEEKEAYAALERVRARILKEDEERAELLKAATEQQVQ